MGVEEILRQAPGLLAEKEKALVGVIHFRVGPGRFRGEQPHLTDPVPGEEVLQVFVDPNIQQLPVVQPGPLELPVGDLKAQGLDQMQAAAGGGAGAGDVAGVLGDLRLHQYDVEHILSYFPLNCNEILRIYAVFRFFYRGRGLVLVYSTKRKGVRPSIWVGWMAVTYQFSFRFRLGKNLSAFRSV